MMTAIDDTEAAASRDADGADGTVVEMVPGASQGANAEHPARHERDEVSKIIASAIELADHMEREAELIVAERLAQADEELASRRRMMEQAEIDLESRRSRLEDELRQLEESARDARALIESAEHDAAELVAQAKTEAHELLEQAQGEAAELLDRARGEATELLDRAHVEASEVEAPAEALPEPDAPQEQKAAWEAPPLSLEDLAGGSLPRLSHRSP